MDGRGAGWSQPCNHAEGPDASLMDFRLAPTLLTARPSFENRCKCGVGEGESAQTFGNPTRGLRQGPIIEAFR